MLERQGARHGGAEQSAGDVASDHVINFRSSMFVHGRIAAHESNDGNIPGIAGNAGSESFWMEVRV